MDLIVFSKNDGKMAKSKIFDRIFLAEIESECFRTYFKTKISKLKIFSYAIFFLGLSRF